MRRRSFTSSLCSRKNLGTRLEFRRCKSARLTQFLLIFLQFSPSFFSVLVFHHGLFHKFPNKTKTKQSMTYEVKTSYYPQVLPFRLFSFALLARQRTKRNERVIQRSVVKDCCYFLRQGLGRSRPPNNPTKTPNCPSFKMK